MILNPYIFLICKVYMYVMYKEKMYSVKYYFFYISFHMYVYIYIFI